MIWQNADALPDELDLPCETCEAAIVAAVHAPAWWWTLCASGHTHAVAVYYDGRVRRMLWDLPEPPEVSG